MTDEEITERYERFSRGVKYPLPRDERAILIAQQLLSDTDDEEAAAEEDYEP